MTRRPIFGFGWPGAAAGAVLLTLLWLWFRGSDLRYHLMELILRLGGIDAVYAFVVCGLHGHFFAAWNPMFSLVTLCALLPALHVDPRPGFGRRAAIASVWAATGPVLWFMHASGRFPIDLSFVIVSRQASATITTTVLGGGVLWVVTRSPVVVIVGIALGALLFSLEHVITTWAGVFEYAVTVTWNAAVAAAAMTVAVRRRRRVFDENHCRDCGYDLRGLTPGIACPECGRPQSTPADAAAAR